MLTERQRLDALYKMSRILREQEANVQNILQVALTSSAESIGAKHGCLITFHKDDRVNNKLILGPQGNLEGRYALWQELITRGLIGMVHHRRRSIVIHDIATDQRWPQLTTTPDELNNGSAIGLPLEKNGNMYGVLALIHPQVDYFDAGIVEWLGAVVDMVSASVGNAVEMNAIPKDEARYKWLFEEAVVPMIMTNLDGYIIDVNRRACEFLRYKRADLIQQGITAIHRLGTGPIGANRFGSLQEGKEVAFRTTAFPKQGEDIPVMVRARRLFLNDDDVIVWVEQDISAQMELEQLREDLTSMVYHDLRGPLHTIYSSIVTLTKLLARENSSVVKDLLDVGARSTKQLSRLVESLLDIQRLEEGKAVLNAKSISIHALLAEASQLVNPLIHESEQKLKLDFSDELPLLTCDADMILRVITNLMENAVKYTPKGGQITLSARQVTNAVRISVNDSGPGIAPDMQGKIFEKFSRVKYQDAPKGVGLGLAFCRLAVEAHGGRIWVESEPQHGSSFIFTLPFTKEVAPLTVHN
jgi:NtrC-family two-component system sensor histidine kinase KinB